MRKDTNIKYRDKPFRNEAGGSYHMEQEGLRGARSLKMEDFVEVGTMVTNRHVGINKMIREEHPAIKHLFDIWHVVKGTSKFFIHICCIKKKLQTLSPKRDYQDPIKPWVGSTVNHLYWAVISTPAGNGQLIADTEWKSVLEHIHNRHNGFAGLFPQCTHGPLEGREAQKPWLKSYTK
ncbi:hypothetical protein Bbelb_243170 [Branchiostoma belcheri]|nr:hypothetical protein Bbelb_243170 [Branchiostoma belcheri]